PISNLPTPASAADALFGIWDLELGLTTDYLQRTTNHGRPPLRLPPVAEEPLLHRRRRAHARAWHRGEHGDVQRHQRDPFAASPVLQTRRVDRRVAGVSKARLAKRDIFTH